MAQVGFTKLGALLPGFFNVTRDDDGSATITLRPEGSGTPYSLKLTADEWQRLMGDMAQTFTAQDGAKR